MKRLPFLKKLVHFSLAVHFIAYLEQKCYPNQQPAASLRHFHHEYQFEDMLVEHFRWIKWASSHGLERCHLSSFEQLNNLDAGILTVERIVPMEAMKLCKYMKIFDKYTSTSRVIAGIPSSSLRLSFRKLLIERVKLICTNPFQNIFSTHFAISNNCWCRSSNLWIFICGNLR